MLTTEGLLAACQQHVRMTSEFTEMNLVIEEEAIQQLPVNIDPDIMSGTPVFEGTRVPIDALTNNLSDGVSLDEFLENFPTVSRDQAVAIIKFPLDVIRKRMRNGESTPR